MARVIAVVGDTGTGKSSSLRTLDPKSTYVISVAGKELPFKGSESMYNRENRNYDVLDDAVAILNRLRDIDKAAEIKDVIIDDSNYIMGFNIVRKATETGYQKFSIMAKDMTNLILSAKKLRPDLNIYYFTHMEEVKDGEEIVSYKMKTAGKLIDKEIKLEGLFTTTLFTYVEEDDQGKSKYHFLTNRMGKFPAKSPDGMFKELLIPNDLKLVSDTVRQYYAA